MLKLAKCHYLPPRQTGSPQTFNQAQLWNPADSRVDLHLDRIGISSRIGGRFNIIATQTALTFRSKGGSRIIGPTQEASKSIGQGEWREGHVTNWGNGQIYSLHVVHVRSNETLNHQVDFVIKPGWGITVVATSDQDASGRCIARGNQDISANFDWAEVPCL